MAVTGTAGMPQQLEHGIAFGNAALPGFGVR